MSTVSVRTLNRTALHRQLLDVPTSRTAQEVIEHLVAMQAQQATAPYVGLWARMANFQHDDLTSLLHRRSVVRGAHLRTTQHLSSGEDFRWLRPLLQPVLDRAPQQGFGTQIANLLLGYADRSRVIHAGDRALVSPGRSVVHPTFLVDGFVHGTWSMRGSALTITPFRPLGKADAAAVDAEADRLVAFHTAQ